MAFIVTFTKNGNRITDCSAEVDAATLGTLKFISFLKLPSSRRRLLIVHFYYYYSTCIQAHESFAKTFNRFIDTLQIIKVGFTRHCHLQMLCLHFKLNEFC